MPMILGGMLTLYQIQLVARYDLQVAIDSSMNSAFGFFLTIGASLFIESWRKTQAVIKYMWALDAHIMQKNDERTEEFQFSLIYNDVTHRKEKKKVLPNKLKLKLYNAGGVFALVAIILLTVAYFIANGILEDAMKNQRIEQALEPDYDPENVPFSGFEIILYIVKIVYNVLIIVLGDFFKKRTYDIVEMNNFRF